MQKSFAVRSHRGHHHHDDHSSEHSRGGAPAEYAEPLVELTRGSLAESLHRGAVVVCGPDGQRIKGLGHPAMPTFLRSTAKPLQALPVVTSGAASRYALTPAEIACMCGSLNGEEFQVEAVLSILDKAGLSPELLACGVHRISHRPTARAMEEQGLTPLPKHNNCAGKHAAMLVLCVHLGHDPEGYTLPNHPVQRIILESVATLCNYPAEQIGIGIDDCGAPVFRLPLIALAGAYARLAAPEDSKLEPETVAAIEEMMAACLAHPEMIAGTGRLCTRVMQAAPGQVLAKTGSEGSYALALPGQKLGVALQIEDGAMRALSPAVTQILHSLGLLGHDALDGELRDLFRPVRKNHLGQEVAGLKAVFHL